MIDALLTKLRARDEVSAEEEAALRRAAGKSYTYPAGSTLVREGDRPVESKLLVGGYCARATTLTEGGRQFTAIHVAGDFIDLPSLILKVMDHALVALTPCEVVAFPHQALREVAADHPHLGRMLWLTTLIDAAIHRQWIVAMGRRSAEARAAHLFCELKTLLDLVGETDGDGFLLPISQELLSDALGLSPVHTNRVLQRLRGRGVLQWTGARVTLPDWEALVELAEFDPTYLQLRAEPR
jgi:CRP-like cAMP-binding protein